MSVGLRSQINPEVVSARREGYKEFRVQGLRFKVEG